jgi:hypothetical protein
MSAFDYNAAAELFLAKPAGLSHQVSPFRDGG